MFTRPKSMVPFQIALEEPDFDAAVLRFVLDLRGIHDPAILKLSRHGFFISCGAFLAAACSNFRGATAGFRIPRRAGSFFSFCALFTRHRNEIFTRAPPRRAA